MTMAHEHPFQLLFETLGRVPLAHADSVNRRAYEVLYDILSVPLEKPGRCILLRAPRAGHGKTHLLSRIQHQLGASHEFIPLHASFCSRIDASTVIDDTLRRLLRPLPASGGLCMLDLVTRRLFAAALQPLVGSGEVPCQDREGALAALRTRPIETFDFHHPNAVTAHWTRENFEVLGQRLSLELAQRCDLPVREVSFWVETLFRFAATPVDNPVRLRVLSEAVHAGNPSAAVDMERLEALLGLMALLMRVVLVADDLEGFSTDETAALKLAAFLGSLRQSVEHLDVILALNQDVWENAFLPRLSDGLADRLSEVVVDLEPLTEDEMVALLESRVPGLGVRVLSKVDRSAAGTYARGLIRAAGIAWLKASALDSQASKPVVPAYTPPPALAPIEPPASLEPTVEPAPSYEAPEPQAARFEAPEPPPEAAPVITEEVPASPPSTWSPPVESGASDSWPAPGFQNEPVIQPDQAPSVVESSPFQLAEPVTGNGPDSAPSDFSPAPSQDGFTQETTFAPAATGESVPEPQARSIPDESQSSVYGSEQAPIFEQAPVFEQAPASSFEPTPASSFEPAPAPNTEPSAVPAEAAESPESADTDRVDDLLKQFRERYGRGSA